MREPILARMVTTPSPVSFRFDGDTAAASDRMLPGQGNVALAIRRFASPRALQGHPALIYAHGFGQTRGAWNRTGEAMAAHGYAGLAYDARGHGESSRNAADMPYTGDQFADDLIVVAGEQSEPPVLVGASMGGLFGLIAESRWPGLFRAMVLVDITPRWEHAGLQRILAFMTAFPDGFASLEHAADIIAAYQPQRRTRKSAARGTVPGAQPRRWRPGAGRCRGPVRRPGEDPSASASDHRRLRAAAGAGRLPICAYDAAAGRRR